MGMSGKSKSKSKTTNEPWGPAQAPILAGLNASVDTFNQQQPDLNKFGGLQRETYGRLAPGAEQGILGAQGLVNANLSGANRGRSFAQTHGPGRISDPSDENPHLGGMLSRTLDNVMGRVGDEFGSSGRFGSGMHQAIAQREGLAAENQMRYGDYAQERAYQQADLNRERNFLYGDYQQEAANQQNAIGQSQALMGGSQGLLNNAAELPWIGVGALNGNVRQASNGYGTQTQTQTQNQPWGQMLMGAASGGLNAYIGRPRG